MKRIRMKVEGMTCDSCNRHVETALAKAGARDPKANWRRGEAVFAVEDESDHAVLAEAVAAAGYEAKAFESLDPTPVARAVATDDEYDLLVIGAGSASFAAAIRATNLEGSCCDRRARHRRRHLRQRGVHPIQESPRCRRGSSSGGTPSVFRHRYAA